MWIPWTCSRCSLHGYNPLQAHLTWLTLIDELHHLISAALRALQAAGHLPANVPEVQISRTKDPAHGDYACNIALILARATQRPPRELAQQIVACLPASEHIDRVAIAGPGFINFSLKPLVQHAIIARILNEQAHFGRATLGQSQRVQVEFVSANPTGPLHVGHGRGAAFGAVVANLLEAVGFDVQREYYVNDAGRQMDILALSVWLRYLELCGEALTLPAQAYQGDYVWDIAAGLHRTQARRYWRSISEAFAGVPPDAPGEDAEVHVDALIERTKSLLGEADYWAVFDAGLTTILDDIRDDLAQFGVTYDNWYSERQLTARGAIQDTLSRLQQAGYLYEKDGALWFRSSALEDEKDRVVVRENGQTTYFAADIAYHTDKLAHGFQHIIDLWGADHHGYVPRMKAALNALGHDPKILEVLLVQFVTLYRNGVKVQMSTRSGEFITLRQLRREVGRDAARFFYIMRRAEQHLDFDLDLAKSESADNPVYYIQYAHARVVSVLHQLKDKALDFNIQDGLTNLNLLQEALEQALIKRLGDYPQVISSAALKREPHQLAQYLRELAQDFHTYYNAHQFLVEDQSLRAARIGLVMAVGQVIRNGLALLGVSAPDRM